MSFNITGYHCLQFQTRSDTDDGRGGVGLFINSKFTYVKRDDLCSFRMLLNLYFLKSKLMNAKQ